MSSRSLREAFYREYSTFFERAERTRRWNLYTDIPWERLPPPAEAATPESADLALCAETFCGVEMYLPDYIAEHLSLFRDDVGRSWFAAAWGYEESKHSLALREYLVRSGHRTEQDMFTFGESVLSRRWEAPFREPRQMTIYAALQELTTFVIYRKQRELSARSGDPVLPVIYRLIARDEMAHTLFYRRMIELHLDEDRAGTLADLAHVLYGFTMPATDLLPDYDSRIRVMRTAGIDRGVFYREVLSPTLSALGLTRHDLPPRVPSPRARDVSHLS
jgi:acyl-[acyl-carrier-protein] desaturase